MAQEGKELFGARSAEGTAKTETHLDRDANIGIRRSAHTSEF